MEYLSRILAADSHPLLEPRSPTYSNTTVRRAFIVWLRCGQKNLFRDVCNFYHHLEAMENELSPEAQASSRNHEYSLFQNPPPTSPYQQRLFPDLYTSPFLDRTQNYIKKYNIDAFTNRPEDISSKLNKEYKVTAQEMFEASQTFKNPTDSESNEIEITDLFQRARCRRSLVFQPKTDKDEDSLNGTSKRDIVQTSQLIKNFCNEQQTPLTTFLENFKEHATRCKLNNTVINVGFYIKRKMIQSELTLAILVHKAKNNRFAVKEPTKIDETKSQDNAAKNQIKLMTFSKLRVDDDDLTKCKPEEIINLISDNGDLIKFDDKVDETDKTMIILNTEESLKCSNSFSTAHNILKVESQRCRKI